MDNTEKENYTNIEGEPGGYKGILTTVVLFLAALIVALLLTAFVFQQYEVDGPSMQTTLHNEDRLIVVKVAKTWSDITGHPWIPARGVVVIFNQSGLYNADGMQEKQLVKRVIGLPGDRVVIKNDTVMIYNKQNPKGFDPDKTMAYGKVITYTTGNVDITLKANQIWVMGDNRPDSLDSRYFGPVDVKNVIGQLEARIYPFNSLKIF